jgi:hypothetical protein
MSVNRSLSTGENIFRNSVLKKMLKFFFKAVINFFRFAAFAGKENRNIISSAENLASEGCVDDSFIIKFAVNLGEIVTKSTNKDGSSDASWQSAFASRLNAWRKI